MEKILIILVAGFSIGESSAGTSTENPRVTDLKRVLIEKLRQNEVLNANLMANAKNVTEATNTTMEPETEQKTKNELEKMKNEIVNGRKSDIPSREEIEKAVRKIVRKEDLEHHHQKKHVSTVMDIMLQSVSSQINKGESGKLDQEIDPTRLGLMLSVVSTFFIVYIFVVLRIGKRNAANYGRLDEPVEAAASNDGEALEMKCVQSRV